MDKLKKYIRCGFKILTSWKIIVLFLGLTFITYYIQMNRYVIHYPDTHSMVVHDRIMNETCVAFRRIIDGQFSANRMYIAVERGCHERFEDIIKGYN
jgi:hypothetical protein